MMTQFSNSSTSSKTKSMVLHKKSTRTGQSHEQNIGIFANPEGCCILRMSASAGIKDNGFFNGTQAPRLQELEGRPGKCKFKRRRQQVTRTGVAHPRQQC